MMTLPSDERNRMSAKGRKKVESEFDEKIVIKMYVDAINSISSENII